MTPAPYLKQVARFIKGVLNYNESLIKFGRLGDERADFSTGYIVIDDLGAMTRVASAEDYDGATGVEKLSLSAVYRGPVTVDFYGDGAYSRAIEFGLKMRGQAAQDLKRSLGIEVHQPSNVVDLKQLAGQQYGDRVQITITVEQTQEVTIDTLRIDEAQIQIRTEEGVQ